MAGSHGMGASWAVRSVRAAVFAVVCVLLAAAGHALATGFAPPLWVEAGGFLAVFTVATALAARERSLLGIGAAMLVVQGGLHLAFDAAGPPDAPTHLAMHSPGLPTETHGTGLHTALHSEGLHAAMHMMGTPMTGMSMAAMPPGMPLAAPSHGMSAPAVVAHLAAALVASWCLRRGEAALWSLLCKAVAFVPGLAAWWRTAAPLPGYALPTGPFAPRRHPLRQTLLRHALSRRGPPRPSRTRPNPPISSTSTELPHPCPRCVPPCAAPAPSPHWPPRASSPRPARPSRMSPSTRRATPRAPPTVC
ncbi:hypothetical protein AB0942_12380 [Streptomyces nodosus]|uniref:hypothetical protein n=1 Tax=Streptomyces nodosus TaxID=40318 RepID=UPI0034573767